MIMGRSGSGKSTLERELVSSYPDLFHKIISITTRPTRDGEVDGVDYKFISEQEFNEFDFYDELIQETTFDGNRYGSLYGDYLTPHPYATLVITPKSAARFIPILENQLPSVEVIIIYFNISEEKLCRNMLTRGDELTRVSARLEKDDLDKQFRESGLVADMIITDNMLTPELSSQILQWLLHRNGKQ